MNLKQLIADGAYTVFARMNSENKMKMIESVQYIKQMSSVMEVNIDDWNILEVFGTGRGNTLFIDRREINKRFMEQAQKHDANVIQAANPTIDPEIVRMQTEANSLIRQTLVNRIREMEQSRNSALREANNYALRQREHLARALEHQGTIRALSKSEVDFASNLRTIQEGGFWKYWKFEGGKLFFRMANELWLRERNIDAGIDFRVNLGKFDCSYDIRTGYILVHKSENNTDISGTIHPHATTGSICWGAASEVMHNKVLAYDIAGVMQLLANLLSDYCAENPYKTLYDFKAEQHIQVAIKLRNEGKTIVEVKKFFEDNDIEEEYTSWFFNDRDPQRGRRA